MEWSKLPTSLITSDYSDAEILAIVKYQLVYSMIENEPNDKILNKFLTKKQKNLVKNYVADIKTCIENDIQSTKNKRNRNRRYYKKTKATGATDNENSDVLQAVCKPPQIREDKNRLDIDIEQVKLYGEYANVYLSDANYNKLQTECLSKKLFEEILNTFSNKIETGEEKAYTADLPNAHFVRLRKYLEYRRKNPEKFIIETKKTIAEDTLDFVLELQRKELANG